MPTLPSDHGWRAIQFRVSSPSGAFLLERLENAVRFVAPAHVLHHDGVAVLHERLVMRRDVVAFAVGRAHQDGGNARRLGGTKQVGGELHAVAHGNAERAAL